MKLTCRHPLSVDSAGADTPPTISWQCLWPQYTLITVYMVVSKAPDSRTWSFYHHSTYVVVDRVGSGIATGSLAPEGNSVIAACRPTTAKLPPPHPFTCRPPCAPCNSHLVVSGSQPRLGFSHQSTMPRCVLKALHPADQTIVCY